MNRTPELARRFFDRYEPIHAVTYFSPEARAAIEETGCRGFWSGYFATRAAPLAPASAHLVQALFYNFALSRGNAHGPPPSRRPAPRRGCAPD